MALPVINQDRASSMPLPKTKALQAEDGEAAASVGAASMLSQRLPSLSSRPPTREVHGHAMLNLDLELQSDYDRYRSNASFDFTRSAMGRTMGSAGGSWATSARPKIPIGGATGVSIDQSKRSKPHRIEPLANPRSTPSTNSSLPPRPPSLPKEPTERAHRAIREEVVAPPPAPAPRQLAQAPPPPPNPKPKPQPTRQLPIMAPPPPRTNFCAASTATRAEALDPLPPPPPRVTEVAAKAADQEAPRPEERREEESGGLSGRREKPEQLDLELKDERREEGGSSSPPREGWENGKFPHLSYIFELMNNGDHDAHTLPVLFALKEAAAGMENDGSPTSLALSPGPLASPHSGKSQFQGSPDDYSALNILSGVEPLEGLSLLSKVASTTGIQEESIWSPTIFASHSRGPNGGGSPKKQPFPPQPEPPSLGAAVDPSISQQKNPLNSTTWAGLFSLQQAREKLSEKTFQKGSHLPGLLKQTEEQSFPLLHSLFEAVDTTGFQNLQLLEGAALGR